MRVHHLPSAACAAMLLCGGPRAVAQDTARPAAVPAAGASPSPPATFDTAAARSAAEERARIAIARESAARAAVRSPRRGAFDGLGWVFYFDVALGALAGAAAAAFRQRERETRVRRAWAIAGAIMGAFGGAFAFMTFGMLMLFLMFMSEPSPRQLAVVTAIAIISGALGTAAAPPGRRRWSSRP